MSTPRPPPIALRLLLVCLAVTLLLFVTPTPASAEPTASTRLVPPTFVDKTYRDQSGVFHYAFDPSALPGARIERATGTILPNGDCSSELETEGRSSDHEVVAGQEITFDPATCTTVYAIATYASNAIPTATLARFPDLETHRPPTPIDAPAKAALEYYYAWFVVRYSDPVNLTVNSVTSAQGWYSNGSRTHYNDSAWLTASGWRRTYFGTGNSGSVTKTMATFRNNTFCVVDPTTYTDYFKVSLATSLAGGASTSYDTIKGGGCSGWLARSWGLNFL